MLLLNKNRMYNVSPTHLEKKKANLSIVVLNGHSEARHHIYIIIIQRRLMFHTFSRSLSVLVVKLLCTLKAVENLWEMMKKEKNE